MFESNEGAREEVQQDEEEEAEEEERVSIAPTSFSIPPVPRSPHAATLWEGYILTPPRDSNSIRESLLRPDAWVAHYSVLTHDALEFRPTDANKMKEPISALLVHQCAELVEQVDGHHQLGSTFRPFGVRIKDELGGEFELFATETRKERVDFILAFRDALVTEAEKEANSDWVRPGYSRTGHPLPLGPRKSISELLRERSLSRNPPPTPPKSTHSSPKKESAANNSPTTSHHSSPPKSSPLGAHRSPTGPRSEQAESSLFGGADEVFVEEKQQKDLFGRDRRHQPHPVFETVHDSPRQDSPKQAPSMASTLTYVTYNSPPPGSVAATNRAIPPAPTSSSSPRHRDSRPTIDNDNGEDGVLVDNPYRQSSSSVAPHYPTTPTTNPTRTRSRRSVVPPALQADVKDLMEMIAVMVSQNATLIARTDASERRNSIMGQKIETISRNLRRHHDEGDPDASDSEDATRRTPNISDKIDYLVMLMNDRNAQDRQLSREALKAKDDEILRQQRELRMLVDPGYQTTPPGSTTPRSVRTIFDHDAPSIDTRAAIHDDDERRRWAEDKRNMQIKATQDHADAERALSGDSVPSSKSNSPRRIHRDRTAAARKLEGLDRLDHLSDLASEFEAPPPLPRAAAPSPRAPAPVPGIHRPIPTRPSPRQDPFARNAVMGGSERSEETASWEREASRTQAGQSGYSPVKEPVSRFSDDTDDLDPFSRQSVPEVPKHGVRLPRAHERVQRQWLDVGGSCTGSEQTANHQKQVGHFIGEINKYINEERTRRDAQWGQLVDAVHNLEQNLGSLPQSLLANLEAAEAQARGVRSPVAAPTQDVDNGFVATPPARSVHDAEGPSQSQPPSFAGDGRLGGWGSRRWGGDPAAQTTGEAPPKPRSVVQGYEPPSDAEAAAVLDPFVQLARKISGASNGSKGPAKLEKEKTVKGPRMPLMFAGQRVWGAPNPVADHKVRWGGGQIAATKEADAKATKDALDASDAAEAAKKDGPIVAALKENDGLGKALEALAAHGDASDPGIIAQGVFEILKSLQDIQKKQAEKEAKEKEEKEKNKGLTGQEKAELEVKKAEIQRLEAMAKGTEEREAKLAGLLEQLTKTGVDHGAKLTEIAAGITSPKATQMDPAITEEAKKLLGSVQHGVEEHVKVFRGHVTDEVQRMLKEVSKLRDEKKELQSSIADLLAFQAKAGDGGKPPPKAAAHTPAAAATKGPGAPSVGFFGPRNPK
ncbi:hypothetical protein RQP46_003605 [Phenoliferia psychrophenolica]